MVLGEDVTLGNSPGPVVGGMEENIFPTNPPAPLADDFGMEGEDAAPSLAPGIDPLASVRPAQENPLRLKLSAQEREDLGRALAVRINHATSTLSERYELIRMWREMYDARAQDEGYPWEGAANIVIPIVQSILDTIHARILRVCRGVKPWFNVTASRTTDDEAARKISEALQWVMENEMDFGGKLDEIMRVALESANCFVLVPWVREVGSSMQVVPVDEALLERLAQGGEIPEEIENIRQAAESGLLTEIAVEEDRLVKDGPDIQIIDPLDFVVYPAHAKSLDKSILHGHRLWLTKDDLLVGVESGEYEQSAVEELLEYASPGDPTSENSGGDPVRLEDGGIYSSSTNIEDEDRPYECFQVLFKHQVTKGRPAVWCVAVVELESQKVIKAIRYPYWHGETPYHNYCPYPIPGQIWGRSIPDILRHLSVEIDSIRNARVNAGTLALTPAFLARRGAIADFTGTSWAPGEIIPVNDVDAIKPLIMNPPSQAAFSEEASAQREAERVTGASDVSQGIQSKSERTLGETQATLAEGNLKFDVIIERIQRTNARLAMQTIALLRQYMTPDMEFALTGTQDFEFMTLSIEDLRRNLKIAARGNSLNSNPQLDAQVAEKIWMMMERIPWTKPIHLYAAAKNLLYKAGERNPLPYIGTEEEVAAFSQQQENMPPPPPKVSITGRLDEAAALGLLSQSNQEILQSTQKAQEVIVGSAAMAAEASQGLSQQMPTNQPEPTQGQFPGAVQ